MKALKAILLWGAVLAVPAPFPSCSERAPLLSHPKEVTRKIKLDYPSVLGYVRVRLPGGLPGTLEAVGGKSSPGGMKGVVQELITSPFRLLGHVFNHCREGSAVNLILLDATLFGGPVAYHFEPDLPGRFYDTLLADERLELIPNSNPPEFQVRRDQGFKEQILGFARAVGVDTPGSLDWDSDRIVVEETPEGILVMPSYDAIHDLWTFLDETDYLRPWGDASLVVNIEVLRLAQSYKEEARRWGTSITDLITKFRGTRIVSGPFSDLILDWARFSQEWMVDWIKAVEGIQFVSHEVAGQGPVVRIQATPGRHLSETFAAMRMGPPDLMGFVPGGLGVQVNADPAALSRILKKRIDFYGEHVALDSALKEECTQRVMRSLAQDTGHYLLGMDYSDKGFAMMILSGLEGGDSEKAPAPSALADPWMALAFPGMEVKADALGRGIWSYGVDVKQLLSTGKPGEGSGAAARGGTSHGFNFLETWDGGPEGRKGAFPIQIPAVESGCAPGLQVTTLRMGGDAKPGDLTGKLLRLARMGGAPVRDLPEEAHLFLKFSLAPAYMEGLSNTVASLSLIGYGLVDGNVLTIRFAE